MKKRVYLLLELKRIFKAALQMFAGAIVLAAIVGAIAFCAQKLLYNDSLMDKIRIGIVMEAGEDSKSTGLLGNAMKFLESMESVQTTCEFIYMEQDAAEASLEQGDLSAIMLVPSTLVGDIINGTNTPVKIIFGDSDPLSSAMLRSLTGAGARTLSCAQAGIYTVYDVYTGYGMEADLQKAYDVLNSAYLKLALARSRAFDYETVSVTGTLDNSQYYAAMAVVFLVLLAGMGLSGALRREKKAALFKLDIADMSGWKCILVRFIAVWLIIMGFMIVLTTVLLLWTANTYRTVPGLWENIFGALWFAAAGAACISALFILLYELAPTAGSGVLLVFIVSCAGMLLSGGIIPSAFMPPVLANVGRILPVGLLLRSLQALMGGEAFGEELLFLSGWTVLLLLSAMAVRMGNIRRRGVFSYRNIFTKSRENTSVIHIENLLVGPFPNAPAVSQIKTYAFSGNKLAGKSVRVSYKTWFLLIFKRLFKHPLFIVILLIFPVLCIVVERAGAVHEQPVNIAIYSQSPEDFNKAVVKHLLLDDGILNFYMCDSEEQVRSDVAAQRAECGYILPEDLMKKLRQGKNKSLVQTIVSPATVSARLVDEVVFSYIFQEYSPEILLGFLDGEFPDSDHSLVLSYLNGHLDDGSTFRFAFDRDTEDGYIPSSVLFGYVKGMLAVYIFICGLLGSYDSIKDRRRGVYVRLGYPSSMAIVLFPALASALCAGAASWIALAIMGSAAGGSVIFSIIAYVLFTSGYCSVITGIFRKEETFCMLIPVLTLGSLISAVVPVQLQTLFDGVGAIARIFPPAWFSQASGSDVWLMLGMGVVLWMIGMFIEALRA